MTFVNQCGRRSGLVMASQRLSIEVSKVRERVTSEADLPSRSWGETVRVVASRWVWGLKFMVDFLTFGVVVRNGRNVCR